jgi:hypothetical protein
LLSAIVNRPLNRCQELKRGSKFIFFFDKKPLQEDTPFWVSLIVQFCAKAFHILHCDELEHGRLLLAVLLSRRADTRPMDT